MHEGPGREDAVTVLRQDDIIRDIDTSMQTLCFLEEAEGLHTCVYVADDIVLTKNGDSILAAWALMQLKDVDSIYRRSPAARVQGYRLKR